MKRDRAVVRIPPRPASRQGPCGRAHSTAAGGPFIPPCLCIFQIPPLSRSHEPSNAAACTHHGRHHRLLGPHSRVPPRLTARAPLNRHYVSYTLF